MSEIQLFRIASQQAHWLSERQTVVASNIANASSPGYKAKDLVPFSVVMGSLQSGLRVTNARHMNLTGSSEATGNTVVVLDPSGKTSHSGNTVSIERELVKGSQVASAYSLNTNIVKSFHRMLLMSVKG